LFASLAMPIRLAAQKESAAPEQKPVEYTVTDLGTLGGTYSAAFGINNAGKVAGAAATPNQTDGFAATAYLWTKQKGITDLGVLGPPLFPPCPTCNSGASGLGASGEVAMGSEVDLLDPNGEDFGQWDPLAPAYRVTLGAIWRNGVITPLPNLPGGNNAGPLWINNRGQISGVAETDTPDPSCSLGPNGPTEPNGLSGPNLTRDFLPVVWGPNGEIQRVLSPLVSKGDTVAFAFTINDEGQVVGASGLCSTTGLPPFAINFTTASHAVLWEKDGSIHDLGSLGGAANTPGSINNRGEVVGAAQSPIDGTTHAFLWTRQTGMLDYGAFPGPVATVVPCCHTNNDRGEIVGFTVEPTNPYLGRAVIWQGTQPKDLNTFVRNPGPFVQLTAAFSINDSGEIACQGVINTGELHACLAVPDSAAPDESLSPATGEFGTYVPLTDNARELLRRRHGMPRP
jgi:probable HAF family extracellular repeat protein